MKKIILIFAAVIVSVSTMACRSYINLVGSISAYDNATLNFADNSLGVKAFFGMRTYRGYFIFGGTFEMCVYQFGDNPVQVQKDYRVGGLVAFNPFASIDDNSSVKLYLVDELLYSNPKALYNGCGFRLTLGNDGLNVFLQPIFGVESDFINQSQKSWKMEVGIQFMLPVGRGKIL